MNKSNSQKYLLWLVMAFPLLTAYGQSLSLYVSFVLTMLPIGGFYYIAFSNKSKSLQSAPSQLAGIIVVLTILSFFLSSLGKFKFAQLTNEYCLLPYVAIVLAQVDYRPRFVKSIPTFINISCIVFLAVLILNREYLLLDTGYEIRESLNEVDFSLDSLTKQFCRCCFFLFFLVPFIKIKRIIIPLLACIVMVVISILIGRRNLLLSVAIMAVIVFLNYSHYVFGYKGKRNRFISAVIIIVAAVTLYYGVGLAQSIFNGTNTDEFFEVLTNRAQSDSRSSVHAHFFMDMNSNPINWVLGKGVNGTYYCPMANSNTPYRSVIEIGWLQIILKFGIIGAVLFFVIFWKSLKHFKKSNILIRACAMYIICSVLEMTYAGVPAFDTCWIMLWICVGICCNQSWRTLTDKDVITLINGK